MGGLSIGEIAIIAVVILVVIGPKKLPEVAKSLGKGYSEFRNALNGLKESVDLDLNMMDGGKKKKTNSSGAGKSSASPYKSRWEEQVIDVDVDVDVDAETDEVEAADEKKEVATSSNQGRAGRGSLIIDDEEKEGLDADQ